MNFELVWFDSLGAKSSCCLLESGKTLVIDPGIAVMQPSFPASLAKKLYWLAQGKRAVLAALKRADAVIISHYHYDHFIPDPGLYRGKLLIAKDPNKWINDSQRKRAEEFYSGFPGFRLGRAERVECEDPLKKLKLARKKRFGRYQPRRQDLLKKGLKWFQERCRRWNRYQKIEVPGVVWGDGKSFRIGRMKVRLTQPLFHGIEFARVGWVFSVVVESRGFKFLHSSDLDGPIIEDYAEWIIEENP
ncbi:MAG: MBL fold metallo-hydrolase, partial [Candidatus Aenigmatarchaeota archaeon]